MIGSKLVLMALMLAWDDHPTPSAVRQAGAGAVAARVRGLESMPGFVPAWWDGREGKVYLEPRDLSGELLYQVALASGLGSNPVGLDRGQLGPTRLVRFERAGGRVLLIERNLRYRALEAGPAELRSVEESFATSVLWGFPIVAEEASRLLLDATGFFLADAHGVALRLKQSGQGSYRIDESRSALRREGSGGFPDNTEVESLLTFTTADEPGALVASVAPDGRSVSLRVRHSFVRLPGPGFLPRAVDPRVGSLHVEVADYASPIDGPLEKRWVLRHRLRRKDPRAASGEVEAPIVYHLDPGVPEPVRAALLEGASWWARAFEAAGFKDAFRVEVLPAGADPLDVRYNMIHWVHRSTRGWSYGGSVVDPRTGEILKGNVLLGSLRVRQDVLLASGLVAQWEAGRSPGDPKTSATELALARLRQLSAHEVGHAIGLEHNFAASTQARASVMDYPAPLIRIVEGRLDLSQAYARSIGAYDHWALRYAYAEFAPGSDEPRDLARIVAEGLERGLRFVQDSDARPVESAHPDGSLWDNDSDAVRALRHAVEVRRIGLEGLGASSLAPRDPVSRLEELLLPLYLHHRYQVEAAAKLVGGVDFRYALREEGAGPWRRPVEKPRAEAALAALLATLEPAFLRVPAPLLALLPPPAFAATGAGSERFPRRTGAPFDPLSAAETAVDLTLGALLAPERAARLVTLHAEDPALLGFEEQLDRLIAASFGRGRKGGSMEVALERLVERRVVAKLIELAGRGEAAAEVRAMVEQVLSELVVQLAGPSRSRVESAHRGALAGEIERFLERRGAEAAREAAVPVPAGAPIGGGDER